MRLSELLDMLDGVAEFIVYECNSEQDEKSVRNCIADLMQDTYETFGWKIKFREYYLDDFKSWAQAFSNDGYVVMSIVDKLETFYDEYKYLQGDN